MNFGLSINSASAAPPVASCQAVIFRVANQHLALPAMAVLKILPATDFNAADLTCGTLTLWEDCPLIWLNLHSLLNRHSADRAAAPPSPRFVIVVWSPTGDRCAIPVDELPVLLEIPLAQAQVIPSHHRSTLGSVARYLVILPHQNANLPLLLLDLQQALHRQALHS